jgi:PAS domain S-box-containing protein
VKGRRASDKRPVALDPSELRGRPVEDLQSVLESTTEILLSVLDSTADGILVVDLDGRIVTFNRRFATMWPLPDHELEPHDDARVLDAQRALVSDPDGFLDKVRHVYLEREAESFDVLALRDGRTFERFSRPWRVGGEVTGRVWSFRDATPYRQAEEKLRASELHFRSLTEKARDLVAILGVDGTITYASPSHREVLGYAPDEIVGGNASQWIHPDDLERVAALFQQATSAPDALPVLEYRFRHRDGSWRTLESVGTHLHEQPGIVVNSRDVSARKRAELRAQTLLAVSEDVAGTVDLETMLQRVQRRARAAVPADVIAVIYDDPAIGKMRVVAQQGIADAYVPAVEKLAFPRGAVSFTEQTTRGETITIPDFDLSPWLPPEVLQHFPRASLVVAPFKVWTHNLGLLVAANIGTSPAFDEEQAALCTGIARQVAIAMEANELFRTQREEAEVANALARFARDLIASVHQPDFLDRLCATTAEVLRCHISSTLVKEHESDSFVSIAGHGYAADVGLGTRNIHVPVAQMGDLLARLGDDDVAVIEAIPESALPRERQQEFDLGATLCMALRQGGEIVGLQVAHRSEGGAFGPTDLRIARGFAQIASLAISHAKLVEELERANRVRSEFVATVSHELRTPLNIILGYGDLLLTDTFGPLNEEQRGTLQRMDRRARELLELVNSTLEVSRLERGQVPIDVQATSLRELLATIDAETHELQERAGIPLTIDIAGGDVELRTDPAKLKVVLKNLVVNALKFTEHGSVTVRVTAGDDDATIAVTDTGIGIPRDALELVFQAFRQAHAPTTRGHGGVGLGLFIVARFVELLRGTVTVDSQVGAGSSFVVVLPRDVTQRSIAPGATID